MRSRIAVPLAVLVSAVVGLGLAGCAEFSGHIDDRADNAQGSMLNDNPYSTGDNPILTGGSGYSPGWSGGSGY